MFKNGAEIVIQVQMHFRLLRAIYEECEILQWTWILEKDLFQNFIT